MRFFITVLIMIQIQGLAAMSLNLLVGVAGRFSVFHAGLMGVGAYTAGLLSVNFGLNLVWGSLLGAVTAALIAAAFQVLTLKMDFFTFNITSFAFQMVLYETFVQWTRLTRGPFGVLGVQRPEILGISFAPLPRYLLLVTALCSVTIAMLVYFGQSQFALSLRGMREHEEALQSVGRDLTALKLKVFLLSGATVGLSGGLMAGLAQSVHPTSFFVYLSIVLMVFVVAGGRGNMLGTLVAVAILTVIDQSIGFLPQISTTAVGPLRQILYGTVLVVVILLRADGLVPERPIVNSVRETGRTPRSRTSASSDDRDMVESETS